MKNYLLDDANRKMVEFRRIFPRTMIPSRTISSTMFVIFFLLITMVVVVCVVEGVFKEFEEFEVCWTFWWYYSFFLQWDLRCGLLLLGTTDNFKTHTAIRGPWCYPP